MTNTIRNLLKSIYFFNYLFSEEVPNPSPEKNPGNEFRKFDSINYMTF